MFFWDNKNHIKIKYRFNVKHANLGRAYLKCSCRCSADVKYRLWFGGGLEYVTKYMWKTCWPTTYKSLIQKKIGWSAKSRKNSDTSIKERLPKKEEGDRHRSWRNGECLQVNWLVEAHFSAVRVIKTDELYLLGHGLFFGSISYHHIHSSPTEPLRDTLKTALLAFKKGANQSHISKYYPWRKTVT